MAKTIAVTNQKGGVGKTTTCINLCAALVNIGRKVMLVDLDPQGNATVGCGVMKNEFEAGSYDVLLGEADIKDAIIKTETGIDVLAANDDLAGAQIEVLELPDREVRLKSVLASVEGNYDYIFIDCPPSLNILTINALTASKSVLIPIQCEYYALEGLSALVSTIDKIKYSLNPGLKIEGLLKTMYDGRNSLAIEVSDQINQHFPGKVYKTFIPRNVRVAEAPGYGVSVIEYDKTSKGATAYLNLAGEFLIKQNQPDEDENEDADEDDGDEIQADPQFTAALASAAATTQLSADKHPTTTETQPNDAAQTAAIDLTQNQSDQSQNLENEVKSGDEHTQATQSEDTDLESQQQAESKSETGQADQHQSVSNPTAASGTVSSEDPDEIRTNSPAEINLLGTK